MGLVVLAALAHVACGADDSENSGPGLGGMAGSGAVSGTGGRAGSGAGAGGSSGAGATAGSAGSGGVAGSGGAAGSGGVAGSGGSNYELPFTPPTCNPSDNETLIIKSTSDFGKINNAGKRIFCVQPGDYSSAKVVLSVAGTAAKPRIIVYDGATPAMQHPVKMSESVRAVLSGLEFSAAAKHWQVHGLTFRRKSPGTFVRFKDGSTNNLLDGVLIEDGGGGGGQLAFGASVDNTVQRSVLRNSIAQSGVDSHCLVIGSASGIRVVSNEFYDCAGDALQVHPGGVVKDVLIANNDLYLTPAAHSDCNGSTDPTKPGFGNCACAENAIDLKNGGIAAAPIRILNNRMWGFRKTDGKCSGTGSAGPAVAWSGDYEKSHVVIAGNIISDIGGRGMTLGTAAAKKSRISVNGNIIHDTGDTGIVAWGGYTQSEFYFNTFVKTGDYLQTNAGASALELRCNLMLDAGAKAGQSWDNKSTAAYNGFFNTTPFTTQASTDVVKPKTADAAGKDFCTTRKRITAQEQFCIPLVQPTSASPHAKACDPTVGSTKGIGVDDATKFTDFTGAPRVPGGALGALEL